MVSVVVGPSQPEGAQTVSVKVHGWIRPWAMALFVCICVSREIDGEGRGRGRGRGICLQGSEEGDGGCEDGGEGEVHFELLLLVVVGNLVCWFGWEWEI